MMAKKRKKVSRFNNMQKVAVIILVYNGKKYLSSLLESLFKYMPETVEQEIIVIDNASTDGSAEFVSRYYSQVTLLKQKTNLGFAAGNNVGFEYAISKG